MIKIKKPARFEASVEFINAFSIQIPKKDASKMLKIVEIYFKTNSFNHCKRIKSIQDSVVILLCLENDDNLNGFMQLHKIPVSIVKIPKHGNGPRPYDT